MPHRVHYRTLANHLSDLPVNATRDDLAASLRMFFARDPEYTERFAVAVQTLPEDADLLSGLEVVCRLLLEDNPRFIPGLFTDWVVEEW